MDSPSKIIYKLLKDIFGDNVSEYYPKSFAKIPAVCYRLEAINSNSYAGNRIYGKEYIFIIDFWVNRPDEAEVYSQKIEDVLLSNPLITKDAEFALREPDYWHRSMRYKYYEYK